MVSEMLHQAAVTGGEHILLKLDVCKAFDRLEWPFILASVEKAGLAGTLSAFLRAGFSSASSVILLNGRPTEVFRLSRSVRQGCPLSPLVFILAFDILSLMFTKAVDRGTIVGVEFPGSGVKNVQSFYADDVALVIRAVMCCILECQRILTVFGAVSGLLVIWEKTIAAFIPGGPPPAQFWLLPWKWEENSNATKNRVARNTITQSVGRGGWAFFSSSNSTDRWWEIFSSGYWVMSSTLCAVYLVLISGIYRREGGELQTLLGWLLWVAGGPRWDLWHGITSARLGFSSRPSFAAENRGTWWNGECSLYGFPI